MGSPLSSFLAEVIMQDLENETVTDNENIKTWYRYVDDILTKSSPRANQHQLTQNKTKQQRELLCPTYTLHPNWPLDYYALSTLTSHTNQHPNSETNLQYTKTKRMSLKNAIYMFPCKNCNQQYIGQTSKKIQTRLTEHQNAINRHKFDWTQTKLLGQAATKHAHEFKEAWYSINKLSFNRYMLDRDHRTYTHESALTRRMWYSTVTPTDPDMRRVSWGQSALTTTSFALSLVDTHKLRRVLNNTEVKERNSTICRHAHVSTFHASSVSGVATGPACPAQQD